MHGFEGPKEVRVERSKVKDEEDEDNRMDTGFDEEYHEEAQEKDTSNSSNSK